MPNKPGRLPGSPEPIPGRCGAKLRNSLKKYGHWRYHTAYPMHGRTRCRLHGGMTPAGPDAPSFKHGRYVRHMPPHLMDRFTAAASDPDLLSLRKDVATFEALIDEQLRQIGTVSLEDLAETIEGLEAAIAAKNTGAMARHLAGLKGFREGAGKIVLALRTLQQLTDQKRKLVETHFKNQAQAASVLTDVEAAALFGALTGAVRRIVTDPQKLGLIEREFSKLVTKVAPLALKEAG